MTMIKILIKDTTLCNVLICIMFNFKESFHEEWLMCSFKIYFYFLNYFIEV